MCDRLPSSSRPCSSAPPDSTVSAKRKAHYLSRFYLAGFTPADGSPFLFVSSKSQGKAWRARPDEAAHQRDLFRPQSGELDPNEIEDAFAAVESGIAPVLHRIIKTETLPAGADRDWLLHVVALNASRPPAEMANLKDNLDKGLRSVALEVLTPELHTRILDEWRAEGRDTEHVEDLDALRARIAAGGIRGVVDRDYFLVRGVLGRAADLVDMFAQRSWTLLKAPTDCEFICSDRPVSLLNNRNVSDRVDPRYDDRRFDILMPLSRRLCLVGRCGSLNQTVIASRRTVGFINYVTQTGADDYIYAPANEYLVSPEAEFSRANSHSYRKDLGVPR